MKFRNHALIGLICVLILLIWLMSSCFSAKPKITLREPIKNWENDINPNNFKDWEHVRSWRVDEKVYWQILKNPDITSKIKFVAVVVGLKDNALKEYRYWKGIEPYLFIFDKEQKKYINKKILGWKKEQCLACHPDKRQQKVKPGEV